MDEYNQGMDPAVKEYFKKIIRSFTVGLLWLIIMAVIGLGVGAAVIEESIRWYNIAFYIVFLVSLTWLIRFFYNCWKG